MLCFLRDFDLNIGWNRSHEIDVVFLLMIVICVKNVLNFNDINLINVFNMYMYILHRR